MLTPVTSATSATQPTLQIFTRTPISWGVISLMIRLCCCNSQFALNDWIHWLGVDIVINWCRTRLRLTFSRIALDEDWWLNSFILFTNFSLNCILFLANCNLSWKTVTGIRVYRTIRFKLRRQNVWNKSRRWYGGTRNCRAGVTSWLYNQVSRKCETAIGPVP